MHDYSLMIMQARVTHDFGTIPGMITHGLFSKIMVVKMFEILQE